MASLAVEHLVKRFGNAGVDDVSFAIESGTFLTLLGPSGCGKTTTLRMVAGLASPDAGRVLIGGADVTALHTSRRNIGMVFQNLALFPHMTVAENVNFGLMMRKVPKAEAAPRIKRALEMVHLDQIAGKYPGQMSGGQQQRCALARALVVEPSLLILDEPFAALDRKLREAMQGELRRIVQEVGITALFVTHDQEEALTLSDRIAVMNAGRIEQFGTPREIFGAPRSRFVADFMGAENILTARVEPGPVLALPGGTLPAPASARAGTTVELAIRPERITLSTTAPATPALAGEVAQAVYHGAISSFAIRLDDGTMLQVRQPTDDGADAIRRGSRVWASFPADAIQLLG